MISAFAVVGASLTAAHSSCDPVLLQCFPQLPESALPPSFAQFCLPQGVQFTRLPEEPRFFGFSSARASDGSRVHAGCLIIHEPVARGAALAGALSTSALSKVPSTTGLRGAISNDSRPTYASKCLVLLSSQPIYSTMEVMLRSILSVGLNSVSFSAANSQASSSTLAALAAAASSSAPTSLHLSASGIDLSGSNSVRSSAGDAASKKEALGDQFPLERLLVWLRYAVPAPALDGRPIAVSLLPNDNAITVARAQETSPPLLDVPMHWLFKSLSVDRILILIGCLLAERRILLLSADERKLCALCDVLLSFIFPLKYRHLYAPVLPPALLAKLVHHQQPFLVGSTFAALAHVQLPSETILFDLDRNQVACTEVAATQLVPRYQPLIPAWPDMKRQRLRALIEHAALVFTALDQNSTSESSADAPFSFSASTSFVAAMKVTWSVETRTLQRHFLEFMLSLIRGAVNAVRSSVPQSASSGTLRAQGIQGVADGQPTDSAPKVLLLDMGSSLAVTDFVTAYQRICPDDADLTHLSAFFPLTGLSATGARILAGAVGSDGLEHGASGLAEFYSAPQMPRLRCLSQPISDMFAHSFPHFQLPMCNLLQRQLAQQQPALFNSSQAPARSVDSYFSQVPVCTQAALDFLGSLMAAGAVGKVASPSRTALSPSSKTEGLEALRSRIRDLRTNGEALAHSMSTSGVNAVAEHLQHNQQQQSTNSLLGELNPTSPTAPTSLFIKRRSLRGSASGALSSAALSTTQGRTKSPTRLKSIASERQLSFALKQARSKTNMALSNQVHRAAKVQKAGSAGAFKGRPLQRVHRIGFGASANDQRQNVPKLPPKRVVPTYEEQALRMEKERLRQAIADNESMRSPIDEYLEAAATYSREQVASQDAAEAEFERSSLLHRFSNAALATPAAANQSSNVAPAALEAVFRVNLELAQVQAPLFQTRFGEAVAAALSLPPHAARVISVRTAPANSGSVLSTPVAQGSPLTSGAVLIEVLMVPNPPLVGQLAKAANPNTYAALALQSVIEAQYAAPQAPSSTLFARLPFLDVGAPDSMPEFRLLLPAMVSSRGERTFHQSLPLVTPTAVAVHSAAVNSAAHGVRPVSPVAVPAEYSPPRLTINTSNSSAVLPSLLSTLPPSNTARASLPANSATTASATTLNLPAPMRGDYEQIAMWLSTLPRMDDASQFAERLKAIKQVIFSPAKVLPPANPSSGRPPPGAIPWTIATSPSSKAAVPAPYFPPTVHPMMAQPGSAAAAAPAASPYHRRSASEAVRSFVQNSKSAIGSSVSTSALLSGGSNSNSDSAAAAAGSSKPELKDASMYGSSSATVLPVFASNPRASNAANVRTALTATAVPEEPVSIISNSSSKSLLPSKTASPAPPPQISGSLPALSLTIPAPTLGASPSTSAMHQPTASAALLPISPSAAAGQAALDAAAAKKQQFAAAVTEDDLSGFDTSDDESQPKPAPQSMSSHKSGRLPVVTTAAAIDRQWSEPTPKSAYSSTSSFHEHVEKGDDWSDMDLSAVGAVKQAAAAADEEDDVFFDQESGSWRSARGDQDDSADAFAEADAEAASSAERPSGSTVPRSEIPLGEFELSDELISHFRQCQRQHEQDYAAAWHAAEARGHPSVPESPDELTAALLAP